MRQAIGKARRAELRARWDALRSTCSLEREGQAVMETVARWDWHARPARSFVPGWERLDPSSHGEKLASPPERPRFDMEAYGFDLEGSLVAVRTFFDAADAVLKVRWESDASGSRWLEFREGGSLRAEHRVILDVAGRRHRYAQLAKTRYEEWSYRYEDERLTLIECNDGEWRSRRPTRSTRRYRFVHGDIGVSQVVLERRGDERVLWLRPVREDAPDVAALTASLQTGLAAALRALRERTKGQKLYYVALTTNEEATSVSLSGCTEEALAETSNPLRCSYADSPHCDVGAAALAVACGQLRRHASTSRGQSCPAVEERIESMLSAMESLDARGLFGRGAARRRLLVAVEVMPPVPANTARVRRLNPEGGPLLDAWLRDVAESP